jgi:DNA mismatch repair protein MutS2
MDRTLEALDWQVLLDALAQQARTPMGRLICRSLPAFENVTEVRDAHGTIAEVRLLEADGHIIPVAGVGDVADAARRAARGQVLDAPELLDAGRTLVALRELADRLVEAMDTAPILAGQGARIDIDAWVAGLLAAAFDTSGQLSAVTYPELGELRQRILDLHESIRRTLEELVKGDDLADLLQDKYVTVRGERYVLPIKAHAKNWDIGIVHGTSGSGRTVFVEPTQVVAINNRLRLAEGALEAAEHRILADLSLRFGRIADAVVEGIDAAVVVDLACAREGLARVLGATCPHVGTEGVVRLIGARHPVLTLRGLSVVPNDLSLAAEQPALVLTGPNTGGKTVALKTIGLCALLVRAGCWIPAGDGSRMDRFEDVVADIGDTQTVHGDLSSFSGHLVALKAMLDAAAPGRLYLLDELCSGTDPAQGGALARAVLEELVARGPRVVVTTHYAQLKGIAAVDARFALAAMEYAAGRPTYRVIHGMTGESHALDTALRMGLEPVLVERARGLMSESERALQDALSALEAERFRAASEVAAVQTREQDVAQREAKMTSREAELQRRARELEQREAARYLDRLKQAEKAIAAVVADLQRSPDHRRVAAARSTLAALRGIVPPPEVDPEPSAPAPTVGVGDRVRMRALEREGRVLAVGDGTVQVSVGGMTVKVRPDEILLVEAAVRPAARAQTAHAAPHRAELAAALRLPGNTLDMRGMRVDDAFEAAAKFLDTALLGGYDAVFLLHGHGTGALKDGVRKWLPSVPAVAAWAPANADQGGDAFTVVALR